MTFGPHRSTAWIVIATTVAATAAGGCGSKGLVPVSGRVTFAGESPPGPGCIYFVPRAMTTNLKRDRSGPLPGSGLLAADGSFRAATFTEGDGLRPGTYEVRLECTTGRAPSQLDAKTHDAPVGTAVPVAFTATDLVVPASGSGSVRYDVDVR